MTKASKRKICRYCRYWDYELAENAGRNFVDARGQCTKFNPSIELITHGASSCRIFKPYVEEQNDSGV